MEPKQKPAQKPSTEPEGALLLVAAVLTVLTLIPATRPTATVLWLVLAIPATLCWFRARTRVNGHPGLALGTLGACAVMFVVGASLISPAAPRQQVAGAAAVPAPEVAHAPAQPLAQVPAPVVAVPPVVAAPPPAALVPDTPAAATAPADTTPSTKTGGTSCGADSYTNVDGHCIHRPEAAPSAPSGASARCQDGTYSFSAHRRGTCSHHGGVANWL